MQFRVRDAVGFELNEEIATELGLLDGFNEWKKNYNTSEFACLLEEKYSTPDFVEPRIYKFEYERGGEIQGLEGFEWDKVYCWFFQKETKAKGWKSFANKLKKKGVAFKAARWSELG